MAATKRLVVCCDGTWNAADAKAAQTNVFKIATAVHANPANDIPQLVLYLRGVGTTGLKVGDIIEGAIGFGIDETIRSAYMFLAQNYVPDDEIFVFGFSRGAFTARSLVGLIHSTGLLRRQTLSHIEDAWNYYTEPLPHDPPHTASAFSAKTGVANHANVKIKFLGLWDTVGALGVPGQLLSAINTKHFGFHDTGPCSTVEFAYHALAIDEHRDQFIPTLWTGDEPAGSTIEQVWFVGAHSDVGGGYQTRELADIPLDWMARRAARCGLKLDSTCLPKTDDLNPIAPRHDSRTGVFALDKLRPTIREVCQTPASVNLFERLYAPLDDSGKRLATINEAIHSSVHARFNNMGSFCLDDMSGQSEQEEYSPKNIAALTDGSGKFKPGLKIVT